MKLSSVYKSGWLRAADLDGGKPITVTITDVSVAEFDDGKRQLALSFEEIEQKLGLNKTNASIVAEMYGGETDEWLGKRVRVYKTRCDFQGKRVDALRIEDRVPE